MVVESFIVVMLVFFQQHYPVASLSPHKQKIALFLFKQSFTITTIDCEYYSDFYPSRPKTMNWSMSSDYCTWDGVSCDHKTGDVIGLDLSCSQLEGAILPNSSLFQLSHLRFLNLSGNDFSLSKHFPQEFGSFAKGLTHLNLSSTLLSGRVPSGISHLYKLVSLDLSYNFYAELEVEVFKSLLQNLTQLRVLNLEWVSISSVLPFNLSTSLRVLNLGDNNLHGVVPQEVFHLPNLQVLDLSINSDDLTATLPAVKWGSSATLQHLYLSHINIDGGLPDSIGFLESLGSLELSYCNLSGPIPRSIGHLAQLTYLDLTYTYLHGVVPQEVFHLPNLQVLDLSLTDNLRATLPAVKWGSSATLQHLDLYGINFHHGGLPDSIGFLESLVSLELSFCNLSGPIPRSIGHLAQLTYLGLNGNGFTGLLPRRLFQHPSLKDLSLGYNRFTGQLHEFDSSKSKLQSFSCSNNQLHGAIPQSFSQLVNLTHLDFSSNNFSGPIPRSFSQLVNLAYLDFSSNNFSGVLDLEMFSGLEHLIYLHLSDNSLSVTSTSMATLPPNLSSLKLSSCNMKEFPRFSREMPWLDLSNNKIEGEISHWIGSVGGGSNSYLNISHNRLTGSLEQLPWNNIRYLDLQSNKLNGSLPNLICNASSLEILNLSHNNLGGVLPSCPSNLTSLRVLDLQMNKIQGNIPATLSNFRNLETIHLNGNKLEGIIPSSFAEFASLQILDLGSNQINDTFPQCLEALQNLQVLVLKSNKFHGLVNKRSKIENPFPSLRIIDLSSNDFSGPLPAIYFRNFKAMMNAGVNNMERSYMNHSTYYSDSVALVIKGVEMDLVKILTVFTTIDLSGNHFEGKILESIGNLVSLRYLNLSHNYLTGHIPSTISKLSMLESLDLSSNRLEGEIPEQFTSMYSLSHLNLSCNQLSGHIPQGPQFNTFENDSYVGNSGLCGHPLSKDCKHHDITTQEGGEDEDDDYFFSGFTWEVVVIGYGCGVVPAFIIGYLMLLAGKPKWFAGIIASELGLKIRRMEIRMR